MNTPLWIIYALQFIVLLIMANKHGQEKKGKESFWLSVIGAILNLLLIWWALDWKLY